MGLTNQQETDSGKSYKSFKQYKCYERKLQGIKDLLEGDKTGLGTQRNLPGESDASGDT